MDPKVQQDLKYFSEFTIRYSDREIGEIAYTFITDVFKDMNDTVISLNATHTQVTVAYSRQVFDYESITRIVRKLYDTIREFNEHLEQHYTWKQLKERTNEMWGRE